MWLPQKEIVQLFHSKDRALDAMILVISNKDAILNVCLYASKI
ncbi:6312_t:CDS:2 [Dentiscutata heterogama]|uniref:6312_t:CDS:1 n=1 Tax=Dentiscutata heterogama TaxID=1316150 RepID=A0ACA9JVY1_9GLOM|nr:6312_t:CDS:2 [Dentiscutata heterogama]